MFILNPYKLGLLNIGLFGLWLFWFLKFKPKFILAILIIAILPIISFLRNTDFNGGMVQNSAFLAGFYQNLTEGNLVPRWAERVDTTYGYPIYLYLYPLPFYLGSIFHLLGASFVNSGKLVFMSTYILSGIWMWKWAKLKFKPLSALAATAAYLFAPYRFINLHLRLDIGESVAVALLPLLFLSKNIGLSLVTFFVILAHPAISVSGIALIMAYQLTKRNYKNIIFILAGVLMASYYWLPIMLEANFASVDLYTQIIEFFPWQHYIYSPFRFGLLYQGGIGKMVFPIGYTITVITVISFIKKLNKKIKFWQAAFLIICFMLLPQSEWLWSHIPLIAKFQFSYRLMGIMTLVTAMITGYFFQKISRIWIILFIIFTVGTTILNWSNREYRAFSMPDYELDRLLSVQSQMWGTGFPQALPRWSKFKNLWGPEEIVGPIEILRGTGKIEQIFRNSTKHEYKILAESPMRIKENTFYYPGWKLFINNQESRIFYENTTEPGVMEFEVLSGDNFVELFFTETPLRKFALLISTISAIGLLGYGATKFSGRG